MKFIKIFLSALLCFVVSAESPASENGTQDFRRVYVARHGQRPAKGDPRLTELGVKQAAMLAERIKSVGFDDGKIYVSPYLRTVETGVQIAKLFDKKVILTPSIQERTKVPGTPDISGLTQAELEKLFPGLVAAKPELPDNWVYDDNHGEILEMRVADTIEKLLKETSGDFALIGHKATVKAAIKWLSERTGDKLEIPVWNCELLYFIALPDGSVKFVSAGVDFLPPEKITNNEKAGILEE